MTTLKPNRSLSSRTSAIPSTFLLSRSSSIFLIIWALLTSYGISVTTIFSRPPRMVSMWVRERTTIFPRPVSYACLIPSSPWMMPPVGKSGPLTYCIKSAKSACGCFSKYKIALTTSRKLCGGISVAYPAEIPVAPLTRRLGKPAGSTVGSWAVSSKFKTISTVSLSISASISLLILLSRASV